MKHILLLLALLLAGPAEAQTVRQTGNVTGGHLTCWSTTGVIQDCGTAANPVASSIGVLASGFGICQQSGPSSGAYNRVCLNATSTAGGIALTNVGGATGGFTFTLNGVAQGIVTITLPTTTNGNVCFADTTGTLKDCAGGAFVTGPGSSTNTALVRWNGTGGTVVQDSTILLDGSGNLTAVTSINKVAITAPASAATLTIANNKTLTASNTLTFTGTDGSSVAFGTGGTATFTSNNLSVFAATTSAQLAGVISDETGTAGSLVFSISPVLVTPNIGVATATSVNKMAITAPASASTLAVADGKTFTASNTLTLTGTDGQSFAFPNGSDTVVTLTAAQTLTSKTLTSPTINTAIIANTVSFSAGQNGGTGGSLVLNGATSGSGTIKVAAAAGSSIIFQIPASNGTSGQLLSTDGAGVTTWVTASGTGTMTSLTPDSGLTSTRTATAPGAAITATGTLYGAELVNAQTGTTYAILDTDRAKLVTTTNAAAQAYSLAQAGAASAFQAGWYTDIQNNSTNTAGIVTITPTTSTINGTSTYQILPSKSARIISDGTNYQVWAPGVASLSAFSVTKGGADQTGVADSTYTLVTWSTEVYDIGSNFASNAWTPPAGKVSMKVGLTTSGTIASGNLIACAIYKNGSIFRQASGNSATNQGSCNAAIEDVAVGTDAYTIEIFQDVTSGTSTISGNTAVSWFMGHWIGP